MSAIDRVKELLAAAETECIGAVPCRRCDAHMKLKSLADPIAQALVESQAALAESSRDFHDENLHREDYESCRGCESARDALRMGGLVKAMEEK